MLERNLSLSEPQPFLGRAPKYLYARWDWAGTARPATCIVWPLTSSDSVRHSCQRGRKPKAVGSAVLVPAMAAFLVLYLDLPPDPPLTEWSPRVTSPFPP
jgi:hypothetical protein